MITLLAGMLAAIVGLLSGTEKASTVLIPAMPTTEPIVDPRIVWAQEEKEWEEFRADAVAEYAAEFTAIWNATEVKRSKNNRIMVKSHNSNSFKFARRAG